MWFISVFLFLVVFCLTPVFVSLYYAKKDKDDQYALYITKSNKNGEIKSFYQEFNGQIVEYSKTDAIKQKSLLKDLFTKVEIVELKDNSDVN